LGLIAVLSALGACGSDQVKEKLVAATTTTETRTVTEPARTVTTPARTETVTKTKTTTAPGRTTTVQSNTTTVEIKPTTTTSGKQSSGGIPAWGWVLIGAGAVLLVVAIFMIGRTRGARARDANGARDPSRPPQSAIPPRGPPDDPI
jgi:cobalamin biosynthesis Mg chelatase CobN